MATPIPASRVLGNSTKGKRIAPEPEPRRPYGEEDGPEHFDVQAIQPYEVELYPCLADFEDEDGRLPSEVDGSPIGSDLLDAARLRATKDPTDAGGDR